MRKVETELEVCFVCGGQCGYFKGTEDNEQWVGCKNCKGTGVVSGHTSEPHHDGDR